jgi:DNA invertase Pin-like site-specific DNA recombinase
MSEQQYAYYIRASSDKQTDQHQVEAIEEWLRGERNVDPDSNSVRRYADFAESGSNNEREDFTRLLSDINAGVIDVLVAWELSRITRDGEMLQKFLNSCEANEVHIYFTNDNISELPPDGDNRFVADIIGAVYQQERRSLIRRVESGIKSALEAGKWLGQVPVGFRRDSEGFLQPVLDANHDAGETGFFEIQHALERIERGDSYRSVALSTPNVTRQTLSTIDNDEERRAWYVAGEADDERVQAALSKVQS